MFKFLKNKLKKFENKLEAELQTELEKELNVIEPEKPIKKTEGRPKNIDKSVAEETKEKTAEFKSKEMKEEKKIKKPKKPEELERKKRLEKEKRKREEQIDKQIERSIETELQHVLRTKKGIESVVKTVGRKSRGISEEKLDELLWDLEVGLLESDVAYSVIESIKNDIKEELMHVSFERSKVSDLVEDVLRNAIEHVLKTSEIDFDEFIDKSKKPVVIMFVGVNGSGKTLSIAKMATLLKKLGPGADPAAVAYDAIEHAKAKHKDVVLLDTAGRMQTNINLMDEMAKIKRVAKPDLILFVGDALSGNDVVEQAKRFNEIVGIDGVILTKVDTDAKGGSALSVAYTIGKPLLFIGVGQGYEDQISFDPQWMIDNIFNN